MTTARYQNPNAQVQEGIAVAHTIHGQPAAGASVTPEAYGVQEGRVRAVPQAHMRNYEPPKRRRNDNPEKDLCAFDGCGAFPTKKFRPYCAGHAVTMGLRENPKLVAKAAEKKAAAEQRLDQLNLEGVDDDAE